MPPPKNQHFHLKAKKMFILRTKTIMKKRFDQKKLMLKSHTTTLFLKNVDGNQNNREISEQSSCFYFFIFLVC